MYMHKGSAFFLLSFHVSGFHDASMANLLHQLGPECAPSRIPELIESFLLPNYLDMSETNVVKPGPSMPADETLKTLQVIKGTRF